MKPKFCILLVSLIFLIICCDGAPTENVIQSQDDMYSLFKQVIIVYCPKGYKLIRGRCRKLMFYEVSNAIFNQIENKY